MPDIILGVCGIIGGLLCAVGDILCDLKGKGNVKSGPFMMIESNWLKMSSWRFSASILLAAVGVPLYFLGFIGMTRQLAGSSETLAAIFLVFAIIGSSGGLFIHVMVCCFPIINKTLASQGAAEKTMELIVEKVFNAIKIPFIVMFSCLVIVTSIILMIAIGNNILNVPGIFLMLNPMMFMLIGGVFRFINKEKFADLPGIIMPSFGLAMIGLMTIISAS